MVLVATAPAFSVVIPTYNRADLVGRAIESALGQSLPASEVIVVDDGSTDATAQVLAAFGERIRVVRQANRGCSAARNHGVATSTAEWIAFLDSDDSWAQDHLESMAAAIEATEGGADFYFADARFEENSERRDSGAASLWSASGFRIDGMTQLAADATAWVLAHRQPMKLQSSVFRRRLFDEVGGLDEALRTREDTHFFLKAGIGRSMCAVGQGGVAIGVEDDPANRLTLAHPPEQRVYLEATVRLYRDVLAKGPPDKAVAITYRRELAHRLAVARFGLAKLDMAEGRFASGIQGIAAAAWGSPRTLVARVAARLKPRR